MFGLEIGAVSVKIVQKKGPAEFMAITEHHEGNPAIKIQELFHTYGINSKSRVVITGNAAETLLNFPYRPETECIEMALQYHQAKPAMLLSLGGENFFLYTLKDGYIKNITGSSKCAAGTGEFIVQQLQRLNLDLHEGIRLSYGGNIVPLAARCSVYCKSDATHKLNKGECSKADIVKSLIYNLVKKIISLIDSAVWSSDKIVITGGLVLNSQFVDILKKELPDSEIIIFPQSSYFEAFGAALISSSLKDVAWEQKSAETFFKTPPPPAATLIQLHEASILLDYRVKKRKDYQLLKNDTYLLGIDAGSTTTKTVLYSLTNETVISDCYLKTHGNPVQAAKKCIETMFQQLGTAEVNIVQIGVTGSGRELVSLFFDNCLCFNEIISHAKAAASEVEDVDTVFEIGGQDSKFISFLHGIPVDYAMNEGCSAGTGSFLEEAVSVDMKIPLEEISIYALKSSQPVEFGERCAAFINSDLRNALQNGASREDIIAGLVYSIAKNYISRIIGVRPVGKTIIFQGGVALNQAVALALAAVTNKKIIVPSHPELMGCLGVCLLLSEMLRNKEIENKQLKSNELAKGDTSLEGTFRCSSCQNFCEIQKIRINGKIQPFGGLCSKYDSVRRKEQDSKKGLDLVSQRAIMMFENYSPLLAMPAKGKVGLPLALSTYEFFPFYAAFIHELGYKVVLSAHSKEGNALTQCPSCYPCEIMHGAVYNLLQQNVDFILLPELYEGNQSDKLNYLCPPSININTLLKSVFKQHSSKLLTTHFGMNIRESGLTRKSIIGLGKTLGADRKKSLRAYENALKVYQNFKKEYSEVYWKKRDEIFNNPTVVLVGKPYVLYDPHVNFGLPQKITCRGYNVIPADMLPPCNVPASEENDYNRWYYTQQMLNAIETAKKVKNMYLCFLSCFSCVPDAVIYHFIRNKLAGHPFCYLEIDSHTAYAGFETRVGAFLDIIEQQRKKMENKTINNDLILQESLCE